MSSNAVTPAEGLNLKRTPLHPLQAERGARFASFAGWKLPIYYSSILQEHEAVRTCAGLFDVSDLGHLESDPRTSDGRGASNVIIACEGMACYHPWAGRP